jgi:drug/metabolite transporter (DMT)-like permease
VKRDPLSLTMWGMGGAALFWAVVQPWWTFPWSDLSGNAAQLAGSGPELPLPLLTAWMVVMGTVVPFVLVMASLVYLTASQASTVGMIEPILATVIAWIVLAEALTIVQIAGCLIVLAGVYIAERAR